MLSNEHFCCYSHCLRYCLVQAMALVATMLPLAGTVCGCIENRVRGTSYTKKLTRNAARRKAKLKGSMHINNQSVDFEGFVTHAAASKTSIGRELELKDVGQVSMCEFRVRSTELWLRSW